MTLSRSLVLVALMAAVATSACGRKADLETPSQAANDAKRNSSIGINQPAESAAPPAPERPFILDALI
jgi:predicted small lipoprotein YifL